MVKRKGPLRTAAIVWGSALLFAGCGGLDPSPKSLLDVASLPQWGRGKSPPAAASQEPLPTPSEQQKRNLQLTMARSLEEQGKTDQAIQAYLKIARKHPRRFEALHRLAVLHDRQGDHQQATKHYQAALKKSNRHPRILCDYGYSLYLAGEWKEAESTLRQAVDKAPTLARAHSNLALVLARTGRYDEALRQFAQAGCSEAEARVNLGYALLWDKRWSQAQTQFQLALNKEPSSPKAREGLAMLAQRSAEGAPPRKRPEPRLPAQSGQANHVAAESFDRDLTR